jgi:Lrp/AsnC family transcriptional regulator, regulator for asnA, asnC and gidA
MATGRNAKGRRSIQLDELDHAIIAQLQEDGRRAYGRIGEAVGLSEAGVRQRVQRLVEQEAIKIVAVTNPDLLGYKMRATIGLQTEGEITPIGDAVAAIEEIDYVVITSGAFNLLVEAQCRDDAHLLAVLDQVSSIPGVRRVESFVYLRLHKQTYPWPPT